MTRSNWYKSCKRRKRQKVDSKLLVELVYAERQVQPRIGGRKLHNMFLSELHAADAYVGRDRFFNVLRENHLLVPPLRRAARTTNSRHCLPIFRNLIKGVKPTAPGQIWVSDITYIRLENDFAYLSLIMDLFSRKIVGYHCGDTLESIGCRKALDQASTELIDGRKPIHHSDRGIQYCCHEYVNRLNKLGLKISMTEIDHCAENSHAERLNGILKQEYGLGETFRNFGQAKRAVNQAVWIYNNRRPHTCLGLNTPAQVHQSAA